MSLLHLNLDCAPTPDPHGEIRHMLGLANLLNINFGCKLNDVFITVSPGDELQPLLDYYDRAKARRPVRNFTVLDKARAI